MYAASDEFLTAVQNKAYSISCLLPERPPCILGKERQ